MVDAQTPGFVARIDALLTRERLWQYPLALFTVIVLAYGLTLVRSSNWIQPNGELVGHDFLAFYMAGDMVNQGRSADLYHGDGQRDYQTHFMERIHNKDWKGLCLFLNPPHYAWAMSWLARLSYGQALLAWWAISLMCFAATILIWRRWLPASDWPLAVALTISLPVWFLALAGGQNTFISLLILTGFCDLLIHKRDLAAGLVLSLLAYKFQFLLLPAGVLLVTRRWRAFAGLVAGCVLTLAFTAVTMGPGIIREYASFASRLGQLMLVNGFDVFKQHSWYGFFRLIGSGWMPVWLIRSLTLLASIACLLPLARIWRKSDSDEQSRLRLQLAALLIATGVTSPHLFHYDMLLLALPAVLWLASVRATSAADRLAPSQPAVRVLLAAGFIWLAIGAPLAVITRIQLSPILMTLLLAVLAQSRRTPGAMVAPCATMESLLSKQ